VLLHVISAEGNPLDAIERYPRRRDACIGKLAAE
jgi:hypothetical protein